MIKLDFRSALNDAALFDAKARVPDDLNDIPFGDPKELPGWVEDESTSDY